MKILIIILLYIAFANSEPPAPYAANGYRPTGAALQLPTNRHEGFQPLSRSNFEAIQGFKETNQQFSNINQNQYTPPNYYTPITDNKISQALPIFEALNFRSLHNNQWNGQNYNSPNNNFPSNKFQITNERYHTRNNVQTINQHNINGDSIQHSENMKNFNNHNMYGLPLTERPIVGKTPQPTTSKPETTTSQDDNFLNDEEFNDEDSTGNPNVAIAVANAGQYYVLQPDGRLQKVTFKTKQTEDNKKANLVLARLMYEDVEPIKGPIYTINGSVLGPLGLLAPST